MHDRSKLRPFTLEVSRLQADESVSRDKWETTVTHHLIPSRESREGLVLCSTLLWGDGLSDIAISVYMSSLKDTAATTVIAVLFVCERATPPRVDVTKTIPHLVN